MGKDGRLFNLEGTGWAVKSVKYTKSVCIVYRSREIVFKIGLYLYCFLKSRVQIPKRQSSIILILYLCYNDSHQAVI